MDNIVSPVKAEVLEDLLFQTGYSQHETRFLTDGFKNGFSTGYAGSMSVKQSSENLRFRIGSKLELWNKVMKEVEVSRYAGPFKVIPFENYIQSPIGLVPKDGGKKTRLIFHLSYPKNGKTSLNFNTSKELTRVTYPDFDRAVKLCIKQGINCCGAKSDLTSAFRQLGICKDHWCLLVMKAENPLDQQIYYFFDKCLPFGAAISCAHFQRFSNALAHIVLTKTGYDNVNYLDDFFFVAYIRALCNGQVQTFLDVCAAICLPVSADKTFWGSTQIVFLGLLINTAKQIICIPVDKIDKALNMISFILKRRSKKATVGEMQRLCGYLNFIGKCVVPSRAFTCRLYSATAGVSSELKHRHVYLKTDMRLDLMMWVQFINNPTIFARPFLDFDQSISAAEIDWYTDASSLIGCGGYNRNEWFAQVWDEQFLVDCSPSIGYLELYAVTVSVLLWLSKYKNSRIVLFCDNMSVVNMINNNSSKCRNCMVLIRLIILQSMIHNTRIYAKHVRTHLNVYADLLSRNRIAKFKTLSKNCFNEVPNQIPTELWPLSKIWIKE